MDVFGRGAPEGGGSNREGSIPPGSVIGLRDSEENGIRRTKGAGRDVRVEKVCEVGGGLVVECFMGEEEDFKFNPLCNREPVEVPEDRSDVVTGAGVSEEASSRVLDVLEFIEEFGGCSIQDAVAVIKAGCNEGMD